MPNSDRTILDTVTIRRACLDDAGKLIAHFKRLASEPGILLAYTPDEAEKVSIEDEQASIQKTRTMHLIRSFLLAKLQARTAEKSSRTSTAKAILGRRPVTTRHWGCPSIKSGGIVD